MMSAMSYPTPSDSPRIYKREWKRNKPHLQKSTSLPMLQLTPTNRPLFTCKQCGFANTYIPLCLWCSWTSKDAQNDFELSQPRARRASAPPKAVFRTTFRAAGTHDPSNAPSMQTPQRQEPSCTIHLATAFDGKCNTRLSPIKGNTASKSTPLSPLPIREGINNDRHDKELNQPSIRLSDDTIYETAFGDFVVIPQEVATATEASPVSPPVTPRSTFRAGSWRKLAAKASPTRFRRSSPAPSMTLERSTKSESVDRSKPHDSDATTPMTKFASKASCSLSAKCIVVDLANSNTFASHKANDITTIPSSPVTPTSSPQKTLRRKKHLAVFRASSPSPTSATDPIAVVVPPRPASQPHKRRVYSPQPHYLPLALPTSDVSSSIRSDSPGPHQVRLGHPSRPYYSAIRKNMSRPSSPSNSNYLTSTSSSSAASFCSPSSSRPTSLSAVSSHTPHPTGFSLLQPSCFLDTPFDDDDDQESIESPMPHRVPRKSASCTLSRQEGGLHIGGFAGSLHGPGAGFSMSGETELKMALAKEGVGSAGDTYRFTDMKADHGLVGRVRRLRRGLQDMMARGA